MKSRIRTYAGIPFPPFPEQKLDLNDKLTFTIAIKGRIPSKKNNITVKLVYKEAIKLFKEISKDGKVDFKAFFSCLRKVKSVLIGNLSYFQFRDEQKPLIQKQMKDFNWKLKIKGQNVFFPLKSCTANFQMYFKDYKPDTINKVQTLQDLLVHCGVITDDNYTILNPINMEAACFKDEIVENMALISLTFNRSENA